VLERDDHRVEDERDESADETEQQQVAQVIDHLSRDVDGDHREDREEDGEDRHLN
jgi:hypothetical protein